MCRMALFINSPPQMGRTSPRRSGPLAARQKLVFTIRSAGATSSSVSGSCAAQRCPEQPGHGKRVPSCPGQLLVSYVSYGLETAVGSLWNHLKRWDLLGILWMVLADSESFTELIQHRGGRLGLFWRLLDSTRIIGRAKESFIINHTNPQNHRK